MRSTDSIFFLISYVALFVYYELVLFIYEPTSILRATRVYILNTYASYITK